MLKRILFLLFVILLAGNLMASVDTIQFFSNSLHKNVKFVVIQPKNPNKSLLSTVYLLHGYGGNYAQWLHDAPALVQRSEELNLIFICPDGSTSWYFDSPIDSSIKYESCITKDLIPYVDQHYPTLANKQHRAITGLSMGGHGALYLAIRNLDLFGAAGSIAGGVDFRPFPNNWDIKKSLGLYESNQAIWEQHTVNYLVDQLPNNALKLIFDCGVDDFFLKVNRSLHEKLQTLKINHDYSERPGGHNRAYWSNSIDFQLLFFKKYFGSNN
jgi:S-formylglutathione hydrolase FrmB